MDKALEQSLSSKSFVKGLLCADLNGLLITGTTLRSEIQVTTTLTLFTLQVESFPEDLSSSLNFHQMISFLNVFINVPAKGEINGADAGRYSSISRQASSLHSDQSPPTVLIETTERNIIVKDYDAMTIVLRCALPNEQ